MRSRIPPLNWRKVQRGFLRVTSVRKPRRNCPAAVHTRTAFCDRIEVRTRCIDPTQFKNPPDDDEKRSGYPLRLLPCVVQQSAHRINTQGIDDQSHLRLQGV